METIIASGTFDRLHEGHKYFLKKAFEYGYVLIGLTSDEMVQDKKYAEKIWDYSKRKRKIKDFLRSLGHKEKKDYEIIKIDDTYGFSLERDADYILVTEETYKNAEKINEKRRKLGMKKLQIVKIDLLSDERGKISSTRLRS